MKDQGKCGGCWAFSATEAIESAWILKGRGTVESVILSPQQILDCDKTESVKGCDGGETESAFKYIAKAGGQESERKYPFTQKEGECEFDAQYVVAEIDDYTAIPKDESTLASTLVSTGPLSICLDATRWNDYPGGVVNKSWCCESESSCVLNHCVQLVGYNTTAQVPYWIVRNSWGKDWGIHGYIHLEMGQNTCAIDKDVTWPTVKKSRS